MIIAISVITRTGYNEQIRLDLGARYMRFLLYCMTSSSCNLKKIAYFVGFLYRQWQNICEMVIISKI